MRYRPRWYVVLAALMVLVIGFFTVESLLDPSGDIPPPAPIGPVVPPGYAVDWVPVGGQTYPCIRYIFKTPSIACDFSRPSPIPSPDRSRE